MIFQRSVLHEQMGVAIGIFLTLLTITSVLFLVKGLRAAALGSIGVDAVAQLLAISTLKYLPLLIVATISVAIVVTLSRLYQESEMVVWQTSGVSALGVLRPVAMLVLPMFVFLLFLNSMLAPWTSQQLATYRNQSGIAELNLIKSGEFRDSSGGNRVFFIEQIDKTSPPVFKNIFVAQKGKGGETTLVLAKYATLRNTHDNRPFMVLDEGVQYQDNVKDQILQSMRYGQYGFSIDEFTKIKTDDLAKTPTEQIATQALIEQNDKSAWSELYRRFSDAFMIVPMALFAVVLSYVRPRSARTWGVLMAVVLFAVYVNLIKLGESRIDQGRWSILQSVLLIHGGTTAIAILGLWYRAHAWRLPVLSLLLRNPR
ncbi:LPS export ABC transporter permease LptF [Formosimonas limnophila]|uniref:Lipopolysaccharide export system permease protein LptF n=1 Tax=Formosimonas limnophila TaxID=1384487 RepID=A0A8J3FXQ9_9BURK|nr:LPS export ABC transporter permease LptF [Formosimonas limnophila]GHA66759.1 LPS export ABC transporter permease LptF [Formosimonas limnophila]